MSVIVEMARYSEEPVLLACRGCLATDTVLHNLTEKASARFFSEFTGFPMSPSDGFPQHMCSVCLVLMRKSARFRYRCVSAQWLLQQMRSRHPVLTTELIKTLDRNNLKYELATSDTKNLDIFEETTEKDNNEKIFNELVENIDHMLENNSDSTQIERKRRKTNKTKNKEDKNLTNENDQEKDVKRNKRKKVYKKRIKKEDSDREFNTSDDEVLKIEDKQKIKEELDIIEKDIEFDNTDQYFEIETTVTHIKSENEDENELNNTQKVKQKKKDKTKVKRERKKNDKSVDNEIINDEWMKIIQEIKDEIANDKIIKRKIPTRKEIRSLTKKAEEFSCRYNTEVRFLSKEEQQWEIELKRSSEEFQKAAFKCLECGKMFTSQETYNTHWSAHDPNNGDYICEICRYRFKTRLQFMRHFLIQHTRKLTCKDCGQINRSWTKAKEHYDWHQGSHQNIRCEICGVVFALRKNYLMHLRNKHGGRADGPQCLLCDRPFFNDHGLNGHMVKMHQYNPRCVSCGGVFTDLTTLAVHVNAPGGCQTGYSSCPKCGRNFPTEGSMTSHYKQEHRKDHHKCEQCNKSFSSYDKYSSHMRYHNWRSHSDQNPAMENEPTDGPSRRSAYKIKGRSEKRFFCEICGKEKPCMALLREHQLVHTDEKPYQCDYCQKSFKWKQYLRTHIRTHTGEKNYKCPMCPKAFRQYQHRTIHILTHTQEKPHVCSVCGKRFSVRSNLNEHSRTVHAGLPPRRRARRPIETRTEFVLY